MDEDMSAGVAGPRAPPGTASPLQGGHDKGSVGGAAGQGPQGLGPAGGDRESTLTQEEMDEGWQEVATRRSGRRR